MVLPFLSPKSYRKIYPLESLILLHRSHQVSLAGMHLSLPLLEDESRVIAERQDLFPSAHKRAYAAAPAARGWFSGLQDMMGMAASYLPYGATPALPLPELAGQGCYGRTAEDLVQAYGGVPMVMDQMREAILGECSKVEGIFRGTPGVSCTGDAVDMELICRLCCAHLLSLCLICPLNRSQPSLGAISPGTTPFYRQSCSCGSYPPLPHHISHLTSTLSSAESAHHQSAYIAPSPTCSFADPAASQYISSPPFPQPAWSSSLPSYIRYTCCLSRTSRQHV